MWGIIAAIAKQGINYLGAKKSADAQNDFNEAQHQSNINTTQHMIGNLAYRVDQKKADITRDRINTAIAINKVVRVAEGESAVTAAQMGAEGRRVEHKMATEHQREGADKITEANVTEQIELRNASNEYTDMANQMVDNLNNARPIQVDTPDPLTSIIGGVGGVLDAYTTATPEARAKVRTSIKNVFKPKVPTFTNGSVGWRGK